MSLSTGGPVLSHTPPTALTIRERCNGLRNEIKAVGSRVLDLKASFAEGAWSEPDDTIEVRKKFVAGQGSTSSDLGEMLANATLSFRHLEDASMRLGKVIQAWDGGKSIYDKG